MYSLTFLAVPHPPLWILELDLDTEAIVFKEKHLYGLQFIQLN